MREAGGPIWVFVCILSAHGADGVFAVTAGVFVIKRFFVHRDLWDWLELLIVPAVVAAGGLWFNRQQRERELGIATEQRERDIEIVERRRRGTPSLPRSDVGDAHTEHGPTFALVLPRLDRDRKASVVQFLYDVGLISRERPVLEFLKANLLHEPGGRKVQAC